jgi:hypothetical protein
MDFGVRDFSRRELGQGCRFGGNGTVCKSMAICGNGFLGVCTNVLDLGRMEKLAAISGRQRVV